MLVKLQVNALQLGTGKFAVGGWFGGGAPAGLSASMEASHVHGVLGVHFGSLPKNQCHLGSTEPALVCTALSASVVIVVPLPCASMGPKPAGKKRPAAAFDIVTP